MYLKSWSIATNTIIIVRYSYVLWHNIIIYCFIHHIALIVAGSLVAATSVLIGVVSVVVLILCIVLWKRYKSLMLMKCKY